MIDIRNVSFGYGRKILFDNLSLNLPAGHIYGLLGHNGAGKSTLLKMMAGLVFPKTGGCYTLGHEAKKRQPSLMQQLFLLPEEPYTPNLTIERFVKLYAPFYENFDHAFFAQCLVDFEVPSSQKFEKISFGQRKKAFISFALAANTPLLLLDEPTNGLDIPSKSAFRKIIAGAMTSERCIVISTHQVRDLDSLIDSLLILNNGRITYQKDLNALGNDNHLDLEQIFIETVKL